MKRRAKTRDSVTQVLRQAMRDSGVSLRRIALDTGLSYASLWRFLHEGQDLGGSKIDVLSRYFGLRLTAERKGEAR